MVREHTTIKMAKRVEELSEANFSSSNLSREEKSKEFLESIIHEWVIKPDPENPSISYRQVVWDESETHYEDDGPEPIPCICGQPIRKGEYYIAANLINGNMIHLGATCYDTFITKKRTYKEYTKRINRRLRNPTQNKRYFENMSDYTRAVVEEVIKKWELKDCLNYLNEYQDNAIIRINLIEEVTKKVMRQTTAQTTRLEGLQRQVKLETKTANRARERATDLEVELLCMKQENQRLTKKVKWFQDIRNKRDSMMNMLGSYNH
jgi:hypothetical protein